MGRAAPPPPPSPVPFFPLAGCVGEGDLAPGLDLRKEFLMGG